MKNDAITIEVIKSRYSGVVYEYVYYATAVSPTVGSYEDFTLDDLEEIECWEW